jgi:integrase
LNHKVLTLGWFCVERKYDKVFNRHWIYLDDDSIPLLIPCLYSRYTSERGVSVELKAKKDRISDQTEHYFEEVEIGNDGQYVRGNQLGLFLDWVDEQAKSGSSISLTNHTALPQDIINGYINTYLIEKKSKSEMTVSKAVYSLQSYYNWLHHFFDNRYKNIGIFASYRALARSNNKQDLLVKYLLPATRELLYRQADTLLEEIVLRNGGDLGCRTKENQGFLLDDFATGKKKQKGILSLFKELERKLEKEEYGYHLSSLYTKYGRSRTLYIPRELLRKMKRYYDLERPHTDSNHLFVSNSNNKSKGQCISVGFGSNVFHQILNKVIQDMQGNPEMYLCHQTFEEGHVYHHLRHSFGTDVFYEECRRNGKEIDSITTESAVYIETARRLGHKVDSRFSAQTAKTYIHACGQRERLLKETINE